METQTAAWLKGHQLGAPCIHRNFSITPLIRDDAPGALSYLLLEQALEAGKAVIVEVSENGEVPTLKVNVTGPESVLIIDGEELKGAKQNRVVNTSILLPGNTETLIPVSCTERGRWRYHQHGFSKSGNIMASKGRVNKMRSVSHSRRTTGTHRSDQGRVWEDIEELHREHGTDSDTRAMEDVYRQRRHELREFLNAYQQLPQQTGILCLVDNKVVGLDVFSHPDALAAHYWALLNSYALDAINVEAEPEEQNPNDLLAAAERFIDACCTLHPISGPTIGLGTEYRYQSGRIVGTSLVTEQGPIHAAFFQDNKEEEQAPRSHRMPSNRARSLRDILNRDLEES